jgi:two-component system OmpR family sensor kinase
VTATLILIALALSAAGVGTYLTLQHFLVNRIDRQLEMLADLGSSYATTRDPSRIIPRFGDRELNIAGMPESMLVRIGFLPPFLQTRAPDHRVLETVSDPGSAPPRLPAVLPVGAGPDRVVSFDASAQHGDRAWRVRAEGLPGDRGYLVIALPLDDVREILGQLAWIEAVVVVAVLLVVAALAIIAVTRATVPLEEFARTAHAIDAGDLSRRVRRADQATEIGRLGVAFNRMLDRLEVAFRERKSSDERMRRVLADASHELRTPLTSIQGYAELFRHGAHSRPADLAKAMARIEAEAGRMAVLIEELTLLARLDQGRSLERAPVELSRMAAEAVEDARVVEPDRPIAYEDSGPVVVVGDEVRLRQALANLLANVREHTPRAAPAIVRVGAAAGTAQVEVIDSGPGLTPQQCERVFERFHRIAPPTSVQGGHGGSGLGLSIVRSIAEAHGGRAGAASVYGVGTRFWFELPLG